MEDSKMMGDDDEETPATPKPADDSEGADEKEEM